MGNKSLKTNKKFAMFSWILVFVWMGFIFFMSAQDSTSSSGYSMPITERVAEIQYRLGAIDSSQYESTQYLTNLESDVRMAAHSTVFFVLSVLVSMAMIASGIKRRRVIFLSVALSLLYAFADEFHQFFVPGRASEMLDIYLDTLGILFGTLLTTFASGLFAKKEEKKRASMPEQAESQKVSHVRRTEVLYKDKPQHNNKVLEFKPKVQQESNEEKETALLVKKEESKSFALPVWVRFGFAVSFSVLCAVISSDVKLMPITALAAFITVVIISAKTKFLSKSLNKIKPLPAIFSIVLALFTAVQVYASFRLVANSYIAEQGTVIEDFYYNFIRASLTAFAVPALSVLWYIVINKAKKLTNHMKLKKSEKIYILAFTALVSLSMLFVYSNTIAFYLAQNNVIFSLDTYTSVAEFSYTNFTSSVNTLFQPVFSLGAMPFGVVAKILSYPLNVIPGFDENGAYALGLAIVNALIVAFSFILLARTVNIKKKALFIAFVSVSFPTAIAVLIPSSGAIVLFYLALLFYIAYKTDFDYRPVLTVIYTSFLPFVLLPVSLHKGSRNKKNWGIAYIYLILCIALCGNFSSYLTIVSTIKHVPKIAESIRAVVNYFAICILAPSGAVTSLSGYMYEYTISSYMYLAGAVVAIAILCGFVIKRRDSALRTAFLVIIIGAAFSLYFVAALVPSGIIAYLIIFSWAIAAMMFITIEKVFLRAEKIASLLMGAAVAVVSLYNLYMIRDVIVFAFNYYAG